MRTRNLYAVITALSQGTIYFDLPDTTRIRSVLFSTIVSTSSVNGDFIECELCNAATCQLAVNDTQGIIAAACFGIQGTGTPASLAVYAANQVVPCDYQGRKGDRIYLNVNESGGSTWRVHCLVTFD